MRIDIKIQQPDAQSAQEGLALGRRIGPMAFLNASSTRTATLVHCAGSSAMQRGHIFNAVLAAGFFLYSSAAILAQEKNDPVSTAQAVEPEVNCSMVLVVDFAGLFRKSRWGRRVNEEVSTLTEKTEKESSASRAYLEKEEEFLTENRRKLAPDEFRRRAEAFDFRFAKAKEEAEKAEKKKRDLIDTELNNFKQAVKPIMETVMIEHGSCVIVPIGMVIVSEAVLDVTNEVADRANAMLSDGSVLEEP